MAGKRKVKSHTLASDTSIPGYAHRLALPIRRAIEGGAVVAGPIAAFLSLIQVQVPFGRDQRGHDNPFGDGWPVDAAAGRDGDVGVGEDRVVDVVVDARGEEVDEFEAGWHEAGGGRG